MAKIAVLGAGAWGTALAMHISHHHQVALWARNAGHVSGMRKARANPLHLGDFKFNAQLQVEDNLQLALQDADLILGVERNPDMEDQAIIRVVLARTAPTGEVHVKWDWTTMEFEEVSDYDDHINPSFD